MYYACFISINLLLKNNIQRNSSLIFFLGGTCYCFHNETVTFYQNIWWQTGETTHQKFSSISAPAVSVRFEVIYSSYWLYTDIYSLFHSLSPTPNYLYPFDIRYSPYNVSKIGCCSLCTSLCISRYDLPNLNLFFYFLHHHLFTSSCSSWHTAMFLVSQVYRLVTYNLCQTWPWTKS